MKTITISKKGSRSEFNEDALLSLPVKGVFLVSDGVGGGPSGHKASRTTVHNLYETLSSIEITQDAIIKSISTANDAVYQKALEGEHKGMACTLVLAWCDGERLTCFNIGDSRIYRIRNGLIEQLTSDQTKQVKRNDRMKSLVTNAIGVKPSVTAELTEWDWVDGDLVMLMSDGISDVVSDNEMQDLVTAEGVSMLEKANALIAASVANGSTDDKTLVFCFN
ncbi:hypothetical protein A9Q99_04410 [Gammaproteobacteria bacterium 45_16_T64]|nr:hypothetical protein A9Q99_04410 [Gammaproteobacteria bacterium 45_16_T64]